ncbi:MULTISPECIES: endonuclease/exonuclease/phosphatase family protein [Gammaproteobacteria]|uniref:endonuclease/exonuclease/phosphatase family protein n=1 Tax=Gammaproteobacteria TaxID=1236 RepID=UPI001ADA7775|nr:MULTISPECIES: endonuclease/exonuclease/phosphatase family protein [Gammaproteobacteria]MBO9480666.1 endonuclease/exonuclease/phosphatase family protein [Salinisphaera sp. G21_0]MBO9494066.1 endonuclease/exonuclease/phosphatase family protein [Thalassotalea sp. G20_0]
MNVKKTLLAAVLATSTILLSGCNEEFVTEPIMPVDVKFASFNVSFAVDGDAAENYQRWVEFFSITPEEQNQLIAIWKQDVAGGTESDVHARAERVIQIRNIAAIIQKNRPDVLLLTEFNNDGEGKDMTALANFQKNYLSVSQSMNSVDGGDMLEPIHYPFVQNYATNTGLLPTDTSLDFGNDGAGPTLPNDAYGFGFYHGHYGFALMSRFEIDADNTRTFQTFKWKDLPEEVVIPTIINCEDPDNPIPEGMKCNDNWYNDKEFQELRLSSKNHVDAPIIIPTPSGNKVIHALLSHPTPAAFDPLAHHNRYRNGAENKLWMHYLNGEPSLYDDQGNTGGFTGEDFVIMGDLNADTEFSSGQNYGIRELMIFHPLVNNEVSHPAGKYLPVSEGARLEDNSKGHPYPETRTSTFGSRVDYAVPSLTLNVVDSGVYWQAEGEPGRLLFNDPRVGDRGTDKEVSSDHRFVWVTVRLN